MMGIPVEAPIYVYWGNQSVLANTTFASTDVVVVTDFP